MECCDGVCRPSEPLAIVTPLQGEFIRARSHATFPTRNLPEGPDTPAVTSLAPIEDRDPYMVEYYSAVDVLKRCLSPELIASGHLPVYSPAIIRSLYYRAQSRNQLGMLDSTTLTLLISLFGSLSIDPGIPVVYRDLLASHFSRMSSRNTYWAFVLHVGRYKLKRGMSFQDSERFWLMYAEFAVVQARSPLEPLSSDAYSAILRARTHYHIIRRHSRHPDVHVHYFETLLAIGDPRLLNFAACDLSFLLRNHRVCHPRLQHLLYRLVIQYGKFLSIQSQEVILAALWSRSCQGSDESSNFVPNSDLLDIALDCAVDTTTIARHLSTTLFGFDGHLPNDISTKLFRCLFSVFSPVYALPLRWSSLTSFCIFNSSEMPYLNGIQWTSDHAMPQTISCWQVLFGLATVEKVISRVSSTAFAIQPTCTEGVLETARTLYQLWLPIIKSCQVSQDLACVIATSFFRITSVLADAAFFYDCQDLYRVKINFWGPHTTTQRRFVTQYVAAAVRIRGPHPDVVFTALEAFSRDPKQQQQILSSVVEALGHIDATLAYALYTVAQEKQMVLDPGATYALAISCAQRGAFRQATLFLSQGQFSLDKRGMLVSAIARSLRENPHTRHPPNVFIDVVNVLAALYHSHTPPEHFRGHLEQLFVVLAQHGRGNQLFRVVLSIFKRSPRFFQSQFFIRYCHALIRHRQFSTTSKLLDAITVVHPKIIRSLRILTDRSITRTKASRMLKRVNSLRDPTSLRLSSRLRRRPHAGPPLEISLQDLLKSGRVLAAKRIFACAVASTSSRRCTTLGNILLHGVSRQPKSCNGRRVRKVLALLENLVKNYGFQPDRVTANILVRAMISWRSAFDSVRLRELFDQLVRGGYPAADYSPLHPPFGTQRTQLSGSSGFSKLPPFVSFEKHTRPLFKMFIKGFYLCNDVEAARKVVGILKVEEHKNVVAKEARQSARSRGAARGT